MQYCDKRDYPRLFDKLPRHIQRNAGVLVVIGVPGDNRSAAIGSCALVLDGVLEIGKPGIKSLNDIVMTLRSYREDTES
jgi:hypothetical protein